MLVTFLTAILFFLPFYFRIFLILLAVLWYGIICGMDSSVLRAVCMGSLSLVALLVGKGASLRRLLGMVYIGMLCYNPYFLIYDVGFLLSFSAVLGIVFIDVLKKEPKKSTERENQQFACNIWHSRFVVWSGKICYWIRSNYLKPSIWATLGIFPIIIFFMGQINIWWCVGNLLVLPLVPFIMIGWFIWGFLPFWRQKYYTPLIDFLVAWNYKVAAWIDQYGITIVANTPWIKFLFLGISIFTMALVIKTLTNHELATTAKDVPNKDVDKSPAHFYDNILSTLPVEPPKKS